MAGKYQSAEPLFRQTLKNALANGDEYHAARARVGLSVCYLTSHEFKAAIEHADIALRYGIRAKDADVAVRAGLNLSSLYRRVGNFTSASQTLENIRPFLSLISDPALKTQVYLHMGTEAARKRDWVRAEPLFYAGIDAAWAKNDLQLAALGWNLMGYMRLLSNDLAKSEKALTEAFRLRRAAGNRNLGTSYMYLGILRMAQGDARSALNLLNLAIVAGWNGEAPERLSLMYYRRAKAKLSLQDVAGALADFDEAVTRASQWREEIHSADDDRVSFEVSMDRMYDDYVSLGMATWLKTRDPALARRMFEVVEHHKSASFRHTLMAGQQMPAEYFTALADYRAALASAWRSGKSEPTDEARIKLSRVEASLGLRQPTESKGQLADVQRSLSPDEALISFFTDESQSWTWAVTRNSFQAFPIPGRRETVPVAKRYRASIETGSPAAGANTQLYEMLFGHLGVNIQSKKDWLLSLDDGLFNVPFAALGPEKAPLILSHSVRSIFGAGLLGRAHVSTTVSRFVGAGDAIYNSADPRWSGPRPANTTGFARLVNTGPEVISASRAWAPDQKPTLLLGGKFNREAIDEVLQLESGVVHIAAHVVRHETDAKEVMIGIGLGRDGSPDFLTPSDIAAKSLRVGLVTVNGCASGTGAELPGAGLMGLTRSWLMAGATAVAATYWPVQDEPGELFVHMYSNIATQSNPSITASKAARALRSAQLAAWRAGGEGGKPQKWAAVFLSSKN